MSSVLFVQCFVFGDGGVLSLGANVFNMALVSSLVWLLLLPLVVWCHAQPDAPRRGGCLRVLVRDRGRLPLAAPDS